jgi:hypothetical protein
MVLGARKSSILFLFTPVFLFLPLFLQFADKEARVSNKQLGRTKVSSGVRQNVV